MQVLLKWCLRYFYWIINVWSQVNENVSKQGWQCEGQSSASCRAVEVGLVAKFENPPSATPSWCLFADIWDIMTCKGICRNGTIYLEYLGTGDMAIRRGKGFCELSMVWISGLLLAINHDALCSFLDLSYLVLCHCIWQILQIYCIIYGTVFVY